MNCAVTGTINGQLYLLLLYIFVYRRILPYINISQDIRVDVYLLILLINCSLQNVLQNRGGTYVNKKNRE